MAKSILNPTHESWFLVLGSWIEEQSLFFALCSLLSRCPYNPSLPEQPRRPSCSWIGYSCFTKHPAHKRRTPRIALPQPNIPQIPFYFHSGVRLLFPDADLRRVNLPHSNSFRFDSGVFWLRSYWENSLPINIKRPQEQMKQQHTHINYPQHFAKHSCPTFNSLHPGQI